MTAWRLAGSLAQLTTEVRRTYGPTTIWTVGDTAHCGIPNVTSDHCSQTAPKGVVNAVDIVGRETAQDVWDRLLAGEDDRIKYMIHDGQIVSSQVAPWQVRPYNGTNPHTNHLHVSVRPRKKYYDDRSLWLEGDDMTPEERMLLVTIADDVAAIKERIGYRKGGKVLDDLGKIRRTDRNVYKRFGVPDEDVEV